MKYKMVEMSQQLFIGRIEDILATLPPCVDDARLAPDSTIPEQRRKSLQAGRSLLKFALVQNGILAPSDKLPTISYTKLHKPYFNDLPIHFNLSHSHGWMVLALGTQPQGVDLEAIDPKRRLSERLIKRVLTGAEYTFFQNLEHLEKAQHLEQSQHLEQVSPLARVEPLKRSEQSVSLETAPMAMSQCKLNPDAYLLEPCKTQNSNDANLACFHVEPSGSINVCSPKKLENLDNVDEIQVKNLIVGCNSSHSSISSNSSNSSNSSKNDSLQNFKGGNATHLSANAFTLAGRIEADHKAGMNQTYAGECLAYCNMNETLDQISVQGTGAITSYSEHGIETDPEHKIERGAAYRPEQGAENAPEHGAKHKAVLNQGALLDPKFTGQLPSPSLSTLPLPAASAASAKSASILQSDAHSSLVPAQTQAMPERKAGAGAVIKPQVSAAGREFFFLQWTLKECLLKLQGSSIFELDSLAIDPQKRRVVVPCQAHFNPWFPRTLSFKLIDHENENAFWLTVGVYDDWTGTIWRLSPANGDNVSHTQVWNEQSQIKASLEIGCQSGLVQGAPYQPLSDKKAPALGNLRDKKEAKNQNLAQNLNHLGDKEAKNKHIQVSILKCSFKKNSLTYKKPDFIWKPMRQDATVSYELATQN